MPLHEASSGYDVQPFLKLRDLWSAACVQRMRDIDESTKHLGSEMGSAVRVLREWDLRESLACHQVNVAELECLKALENSGMFNDLPLPVMHSILEFEIPELPHTDVCLVDLVFCGGGDRELARDAGLKCIDAVEAAQIADWDLAELAVPPLLLSLHRFGQFRFDNGTGFTYLRDGGWDKREGGDIAV